jgi:phage tail sheath protein FI
VISVFQYLAEARDRCSKEDSMPVNPTYPGVYIEEVPSGVRTITGVATSIAAFIGRARRGPVNVSTTIYSYADFERVFGGLWIESTLGYAVRDFFLNGGSQAVVVRLHRPSGVSGSIAAACLDVGELGLEAASPGAWGAWLRAEVDDDVSAEVAERLGVTAADLFNLTVKDTGPGGPSERFINLTVADTPRRIDRVLAAESKLVCWRGDWSTVLPAIAAGNDEVGVAELGLAAAEAELRASTRAGPPDPIRVASAEAALATAQSTLATARADMGGSDGEPLEDEDYLGSESLKQGIYALEKTDLFNLLCIPPYGAGDVSKEVLDAAAQYCELKRRAMLIVDAPAGWSTMSMDDIKTVLPGLCSSSRNAAVFFPRLMQANPLRDGQVEAFGPCGAVAGVFARTDTQRGVWKAPAGLDATIAGARGVSVSLTDGENGQLNPLGINCLRMMPAAGCVIWGARTLKGDDRLASEWKYIPVRRLALFVEESLYRGTQWVVFEPNDEPLWSQVRLNIGSFMHGLFRQGAFQGTTPKDAYFVKCDKETTTQDDVNKGIVNIVVGFAPLKPAEFVIIKLQQMAGQVQA